jgi:hypothetical protein
VFYHDDFLASWSALFEADFVRKTFFGKAHIADVLVGRITKLIIQLSMKTPSASVVTPAKPVFSGRLLLTNAHNVFLQGFPKPVP